MIGYLIWFITIIIGAFTYKYIPVEWQYNYGFLFGAIACGILLAINEIYRNNKRS